MQAARLLVVDDHPVNLEVMQRQLELLGLSADIAEDGGAALSLWRRAHHSVVLLDLHMPVLDGFGLAQAIRRDEARDGLPRSGLVAVTADALKGEDARCFASGMDGFLAKPVTLDALARTLRPWLPDLALPELGQPHLGAEAVAAALFNPEVLREIFEARGERFASLVRNFAESAAREIAIMCATPDVGVLAASAHRLKGAAAMAGAQLLAQQATRAEAAAKVADLPAARRVAREMERLLPQTLQAMRSVG